MFKCVENGCKRFIKNKNKYLYSYPLSVDNSKNDNINLI